MLEFFIVFIVYNKIHTFQIFSTHIQPDPSENLNLRRYKNLLKQRKKMLSLTNSLQLFFAIQIFLHND